MAIMQRAPKNLTDQTVTEAIRSVFHQTGKISGQSVRRYLQQHYGQPGGAVRIYRLVEQFRATHSSIDVLNLNDKLQSEMERAQTLERLVNELRSALADAIQREESHSAKWLCQIDALRSQLQAMVPLQKQLTQLQDRNLRLHQEQLELRKQIQMLTEENRQNIHA